MSKNKKKYKIIEGVKMNKRSIIKILIFVVLIILFNINIANAQSGGPRYIGMRNLSTERETGQYTVNNNSIFKLVEYNSQTSSVWNDDKVIYCLHGGVGFGSADYQNTIVAYTQYFDIHNPNSITGEYRNQLPTNMTTYNELVWVLDHLYNPDVETIDEYLDRAGVWKYSELRNGDIPADEVKDIVEVIEQTAIWYFTNQGDKYHNAQSDAISISVNDGSGKESLESKYNIRDYPTPMDDLFTYLVEGAIDAVADGYTYESNSVDPVTFNVNSAKASIEGNNYIIGPYIIEKNNDTSYTLTATITDGTNTISNAKILNANKQEITSGNTISDKINSTVGKEFYISMPTSVDVNQVKIDVRVSTKVVTPLMWTVGASSLSINQQIVILDATNKNYSKSSTVTLPETPVTPPEEDKDGTYNFELIKQDSSTGAKLRNAKFEITVNGSRTEYTTDSNGRISINNIKIDNLTADTITIRETEAPSGYILNSSSITLRVNKTEQNGKYCATSVTGNSGAIIQTSSDGVNTVQITINNSKKAGSYKLRLIKQDSENSNTKLQGVKFQIGINGSTQEYTTNSSGEILINNIQIVDTTNDTITIRETETLPDYILNNETITLTVNKQESSNKFVVNNISGDNRANLITSSDGINTVQITLENTERPKTGSYRFKLIKQDSSDSNKKLQGVKFSININGNEQTYQTDENGEILVDGIAITSTATRDTIVVKEIETIAGYVLDTKIINLYVNKYELDGVLMASSVSGNSGAKVITEDGWINTVQLTVSNTKKEGSYRFKLIKQDADNASKLKGVKFNISINGEEQEYTTSSSGEISISSIPITNTSNDIITIRETETISGYIFNGETITLTVNKQETDDKYIASSVNGNDNAKLTTASNGINTVEITLENTRKVGAYKLKLIKQDSEDNNIKLSGVKFNININGTTSDYTTNSNGEIEIDNIQITNLNNDSITITEKETATGYILNSDRINLTVQKTEDENKYYASGVSGFDGAKVKTSPDGINIIELDIKNTKKTGSYNFNIIKQDSADKTRLQGIKFRVAINGESKEYTTNSNGEIQIENIPITTMSNDTITITEVETINGYILNAEPITLTIEKYETNTQYIANRVTGSSDADFRSGSNGINTIELTVKNTKKQGSYKVKLVKQDEADSNIKLSGVRFNININGNTGSYVTNSNGEIEINNIQIKNLENDTITIQETSTLNGYILITEPITLIVQKSEETDKYIAESASISKSVNSKDAVKIVEDSSGVNEVQITVNNSKITGSYKLKLVKQDSENANKLNGVKFRITVNNDSAEYITNSNGEIEINDIQINNLNDDTIKIEEIETISGYILNSTPITLKVEKTEENGKYVLDNVSGYGDASIQTGADGIETIELNINNTKKVGSYNFKLIKQDRDNKTKLQGVKFRIRINGTTNEYTTNSNGEIEFNDIQINNLSNDTIIIEEVETIDGYILNSNPITLNIEKEEQTDKYIVSNATGDDRVTIQQSNNGINTVELVIENTKKTGSYNIRLIKQDGENSDRLQNVKFNINVNGNEQEYTTNSNGEIELSNIQISNLQKDTIIITETETAEGYVLLSEPLTITVQKAEENDKYIAESASLSKPVESKDDVNIVQQESGVNEVQVTINNTKFSGSYKLKIIKEDANDNTKLQGVKFAINVNGNSQEYTTNSNGEIELNNISITNLNSDKIEIKEIETAEGYILNTNPITLTVEKEESNGKYVASGITEYEGAILQSSPDNINTIELTIENSKKPGSYNFKLIKQD